MKKISIIVPCYNEESVINHYHSSFLDLWHNSHVLSAYEYELLFIDDGSSDNTPQMIKTLCDRDDNTRFTSFSRNFGKEAAIFCGLKQATGDAVIVMDADLQHPLTTIPDMINKWTEGYDIVEGIKSKRGDESLVHGIMAKIFYKICSRITGFNMVDSSDYKLLDRKVVNSLNELTEKLTFFRALSYWVGYNSTSVEYEVAERAGGKTKWNRHSLFKYAINNMIAFTYAPLYIIGLVGILILLIGLVLGIDAIVSYINGNSISGYPSLVILITVATGGIMLSLGIISVYISKIYNEVKGRPRYIVREHN